MKGRVSSRARAYVRRRATAQMYATCVIERVDEGLWDPLSNLVTAGGRTVIYTGVCRVWELSGPQPVDIGDDQIVLQSTNISIPWDVNPVPHRDDEVKILGSAVDFDLVGRRYRILDEAKSGDLRATRRFLVHGVEEHR
jgi:hypothetical protein